MDEQNTNSESQDAAQPNGVIKDLSVEPLTATEDIKGGKASCLPGSPKCGSL